MKRRICIAITTLALALSAGYATAQTTPNSDGIDVGPLTPYGETPAESANKLVLFKMNKMIAEGHPDEAFALYVSKDVCDHSHMVTHGKRECGNYSDMLATFHSMGDGQDKGPSPAPGGAGMRMPKLATVNGELVTMYDIGVDIFRVHDGKVTDHWDASPPAAVNIEAHAPGFAEWTMSDPRVGPPPMNHN